MIRSWIDVSCGRGGLIERLKMVRGTYKFVWKC